MGLYSRLILPRVLDCAMKYDELTDLRAAVIPGARGVVLEVGIGSGLNLPFYSTTVVTQVYGIDPSADLLAMAQKKIASLPFPVTLMNQSADRIPLGDVSVDTVVVTWSLCSIPNPMTTLQEMRRVLKPDGRLIFIEHGLSPDARVQSWQNRLTPIWRRLAGGCHLNRKMDELIRSSGFSIATLETRYIPGPRLVTLYCTGTGRRVVSTTIRWHDRTRLPIASSTHRTASRGLCRSRHRLPQRKRSRAAFKTSRSNGRG